MKAVEVALSGWSGGGGGNGGRGWGEEGARGELGGGERVGVERRMPAQAWCGMWLGRVGCGREVGWGGAGGGGGVRERWGWAKDLAHPHECSIQRPISSVFFCVCTGCRNVRVYSVWKRFQVFQIARKFGHAFKSPLTVVM